MAVNPSFSRVTRSSLLNLFIFNFHNIRMSNSRDFESNRITFKVVVVGNAGKKKKKSPQ